MSKPTKTPEYKDDREENLRIRITKEKKKQCKTFAKQYGHTVSSLIRTSLNIIMARPELLSGGLVPERSNVLSEVREQKQQIKHLTDMLSELATNLSEKHEGIDTTKFNFATMWTNGKEDEEEE